MKSQKESNKLIQTPINFRPDVRQFISERQIDLQDFVRKAVDDRIDKFKEREQIKKAS